MYEGGRGEFPDVILCNSEGGEMGQTPGMNGLSFSLLSSLPLGSSAT